jgi:hypothetical protein
LTAILQRFYGSPLALSWSFGALETVGQRCGGAMAVNSDDHGVFQRRGCRFAEENYVKKVLEHDQN